MQYQYGGYQLYKGTLYQRGYGLGGTFRRFFNWIVPIVQRHAMPVIKEGFKEVGKTAINTAADIAKDSISGRDIKESTQDRLNLAIDNLKDQIEKKIEGRGIKRKKQHYRRKNPKKLKTNKKVITARRKKSKKKPKFILVKKSKDIFDH